MEAATKLGPEIVWDDMIVPLVSCAGLYVPIANLGGWADLNVRAGFSTRGGSAAPYSIWSRNWNTHLSTMSPAPWWEMFGRREAGRRFSKRMFEVQIRRPESAANNGDLAMLRTTHDVKTHGPAVKMSGHTGNGKSHRHRRFRNGYRLAAMRASSGALLVLEDGLDPIAAADWVGSNPAYIRAMLAVIESRDEALLDAVMTGRVPVLTAATQIKGLAKLLKAYGAATAANKAAFGRAAGVDNVFDDVIAPAIAEAAE